MTTAEIVAELGISRQSAVLGLSKLRKPGSRQVRIADWADDAEDQKRHLRPIYGIGSKPDAPKPDTRQRQREAEKRYKHKVRTARLAGLSKVPALQSDI